MKVYLAPMEGVVDFVIRDLFTRIGGFDQCVTEFIRVTRLLVPEKIYLRYCPELLTQGRTASGVPVYVQLLGSDPQAMAENAAFAVELGAPGIDLNFGCPAKTVNRHDGGASLLKAPERVFKVVEAVRRVTPENVPVTAKVRLGFDHKNFVKEIAQSVEAGGATRLTVHARTKTDGYRPPAFWEYIAVMKDSVKNLPLVANGEIWSVEDYQRCLSISGCEDVAIGRPAMARPDLALALKALSREEHHVPWAWSQILRDWWPQFVLGSRHFCDEKYAVSRAKQWCKAMARTYPEAAALFEQIKRADTTTQVLHWSDPSEPKILPMTGVG